MPQRSCAASQNAPTYDECGYSSLSHNLRPNARENRQYLTEEYFVLADATDSSLCHSFRACWTCLTHSRRALCCWSSESEAGPSGFCLSQKEPAIMSTTTGWLLAQRAWQSTVAGRERVTALRSPIALGLCEIDSNGCEWAHWHSQLLAPRALTARVSKHGHHGSCNGSTDCAVHDAPAWCNDHAFFAISNNGIQAMDTAAELQAGGALSLRAPRV